MAFLTRVNVKLYIKTLSGCEAARNEHKFRAKIKVSYLCLTSCLNKERNTIGTEHFCV